MDTALTWRRDFTTFCGKRRLTCHEAIGRTLHYRVRPQGGFCTVKHFILTAEAYGQLRLVVTFWTLRDAKAFVGGLENGGVTLKAHALCPAYI